MAGDAAAALMRGLCSEDPVPPEVTSGPRHCLGTGLLAGGIEGMAPGLYLVDTPAKSFALAAAGSFIDPMTDICLNQAWLKNAAIHVLFMANLALIDRTWGARGYRYAMLNAGRLGQRLYLQATAMGLGCCGIGALYDKEAADLLGLNPTSRLLYLVGVGRVKGK
jgi:SagB-type dehydrogenase family enzyme